MLQRDYILRLIKEFLAALQRMLEKKEGIDRRAALITLYNQYVGSYDFYHLATLDEVMTALAGEDPEHRQMKVQMLAELFYYDAYMESEPLRSALLDKSFHMYDWLDSHDQTFSLERQQRKRSIQEQLNK